MVGLRNCMIPLVFRGPKEPQFLGEVSGPSCTSTCTRFGTQSSALPKFVSRFSYVAPFQNRDGSNGTGLLEPKIARFAPLFPVKIRGDIVEMFESVIQVRPGGRRPKLKMVRSHTGHPIAQTVESPPRQKCLLSSGKTISQTFRHSLPPQF